jgi:hypothetical protein
LSGSSIPTFPDNLSVPFSSVKKSRISQVSTTSRRKPELTHAQAVLFLQCERPRFKPIHNSQNYTFVSLIL